jgi:hypothetical protein
MDCFHQDELPDEEYPCPEMQQTDCYQVEEFQELEKEELE